MTRFILSFSYISYRATWIPIYFFFIFPFSVIPRRFASFLPRKIYLMFSLLRFFFSPFSTDTSTQSVLSTSIYRSLLLCDNTKNHSPICCRDGLQSQQRRKTKSLSAGFSTGLWLRCGRKWNQTRRQVVPQSTAHIPVDTASQSHRTIAHEESYQEEFHHFWWSFENVSCFNCHETVAKPFGRIQLLGPDVPNVR